MPCQQDVGFCLAVDYTPVSEDGLEGDPKPRRASPGILVSHGKLQEGEERGGGLEGLPRIP